MANERRLIPESERAHLIRCLKKLHDCDFTPGVYEHSVIGRAAIFLEETVDAVEVVRCKDCKHSFMTEDGTIRCSFHSERQDFDIYGNGFNVWMEPTDFCSYGERREGE